MCVIIDGGFAVTILSIVGCSAQSAKPFFCFSLGTNLERLGLYLMFSSWVGFFFFSPVNFTERLCSSSMQVGVSASAAVLVWNRVGTMQPLCHGTPSSFTVQQGNSFLCLAVSHVILYVLRPLSSNSCLKGTRVNGNLNFSHSGLGVS